jgi:thiamine-phosphate pyrophosphorylase
VKPLTDCRLYAFVDFAYLNGRPPELVARQLCEGGADLIQLRAKDASLENLQRAAERILPITEKAGVGLVINDHWALALSIGAPICHLGQEDFFDQGHVHRSQLLQNSDLKLGISTHSPSQACRTIEAGADYVAVGPVYGTPTKPTAKPVSLDYVRWAAANISIPWFAIGGITLENVDEVLRAGARRICVVSAILNAADLVGACQQFKDRLSSAAHI